MNMNGSFMLAVILGTMVSLSQELEEKRMSNKIPVYINLPDINFTMSLNGSIMLDVICETIVIQSDEVTFQIWMCINVLVKQNTFTYTTTVDSIVPVFYTSRKNSVSPINDISTKVSDGFVNMSITIVNSDKQPLRIIQWNTSFPYNGSWLSLRFPNETDAEGGIIIIQDADNKDWTKFLLYYSYYRTKRYPVNALSSIDFLHINRVVIKLGHSIKSYCMDPFGIVLRYLYYRQIYSSYSMEFGTKVSVWISTNNTFFCKKASLTIVGLSQKGIFNITIFRTFYQSMTGTWFEKKSLTTSALDWTKFSLTYASECSPNALQYIAIENVVIRQGNTIKSVCKIQTPFLIRNGKAEPLDLQSGNCLNVVSIQIASDDVIHHYTGELIISFSSEKEETKFTIINGIDSLLLTGSTIQKEIYLIPHWTIIHLIYVGPHCGIRFGPVGIRKSNNYKTPYKHHGFVSNHMTFIGNGEWKWNATRIDMYPVVKISIQIQSTGKDTAYLMGSIDITVKSWGKTKTIGITTMRLWGGTMIQQVTDRMDKIDWTSINITCYLADHIDIRYIVIQQGNIINSLCTETRFNGRITETLKLQKGTCSEAEVSIRISDKYYFNSVPEQINILTGNLKLTFVSEKTTYTLQMFSSNYVAMYPGARIMRFMNKNLMTNWTKIYILYEALPNRENNTLNLLLIDRIEIRNGNSVTSFSDQLCDIVVRSGEPKKLDRNVGFIQLLSSNGNMT